MRIAGSKAGDHRRTRRDIAATAQRRPRPPGWLQEGEAHAVGAEWKRRHDAGRLSGDQRRPSSFIKTNGAEAVRIDIGGNVAIGVPAGVSSQAKLDLFTSDRDVLHVFTGADVSAALLISEDTQTDRRDVSEIAVAGVIGSVAYNATATLGWPRLSIRSVLAASWRPRSRRRSCRSRCSRSRQAAG
jgi:hypothetical protein